MGDPREPDMRTAEIKHPGGILLRPDGGDVQTRWELLGKPSSPAAPPARPLNTA